MKTWKIELFFISSILLTCTYWFTNSAAGWVTTSAIILTFQHAQISDRLRERQLLMEEPSVDCHWKLNRLFISKEVLWVVAFLIMKNYSAIIGCILFIAYPYWRKLYRIFKPL